MKKGHLIGFVIAFLFGFQALGQGKKYIQLHDEFYDEKPVHFGFMFGLTSSNYFANGFPRRCAHQFQNSRARFCAGSL